MNWPILLDLGFSVPGFPFPYGVEAGSLSIDRMDRIAWAIDIRRGPE